jgi:uncharacterized membrane protein
MEELPAGSSEPASSRKSLPPSAYPVLSIRRAPIRLLISTAIGALTYVAMIGFTPAVRMVAAWDVASFGLLSFAWAFIWRATPKLTQRRAGHEDPGRNVVTGLVLISSTVSFFAAAVVLRQAKTLAPEQQLLWVGLCLAAVVLAWLLTQTAWTLRYAHLYYRDTGEGIGGLVFPGCTDECTISDLDFAYFAFTVGMCFQVSDVTITDTNIRRTVLIHACQSFAYNTAIVALALNLAFGFLS